MSDIVLDRISKKFDDHLAVGDVDLRVEPGES